MARPKTLWLIEHGRTLGRKYYTLRLGGTRKQISKEILAEHGQVRHPIHKLDVARKGVGGVGQVIPDTWRLTVTSQIEIC
jgi:hypothetical protein